MSEAAGEPDAREQNRDSRLTQLEVVIARGGYEIPAIDVADAIISFHRGPNDATDPGPAGEER